MSNVPPLLMPIANCEECALFDTGFLARVADPLRAELRSAVDHLAIPIRAVLYREGEPGRAIFFVRSGVLALSRRRPDGDRGIVRVLQPGDLAGQEILSTDVYSHEAVAMEPAVVCSLPRTLVQDHLASSDTLRAEFMRRCHGALAQADVWLTELIAGEARSRLARLFLLLSEGRDPPVCPQLKRDELASILGLTTETVSRLVADFRRRDLVQPAQGQRLEVNRERLEALAHR